MTEESWTSLLKKIKEENNSNILPKYWTETGTSAKITRNQGGESQKIKTRKNFRLYHFTYTANSQVRNPCTRVYYTITNWQDLITPSDDHCRKLRFVRDFIFKSRKFWTNDKILSSLELEHSRVIYSMLDH